jgi:hypothetical protein
MILFDGVVPLLFVATVVVSVVNMVAYTRWTVGMNNPEREHAVRALLAGLAKAQMRRDQLLSAMNLLAANRFEIGPRASDHAGEDIRRSGRSRLMASRMALEFRRASRQVARIKARLSALGVSYQ